MATPTWVTLANANQYSQVGSIATVANFTTATDISPGGNTAGLAYQTVPAQLYPGQMWRFTANGVYSSTGSPGVSIGIYYGGAAGSPLCYGSVPAASTPANAASIPWQMHAMGRLMQAGATTGVWNVIGTLSGLNYLGGTLGGASVGTVLMNPYTPTGTNFDTSTAKVITLASTMTASSASNAITVWNWAIEYLTEP